MFLIISTVLVAAALAPIATPPDGAGDAPGCERLFQGDWQLASLESGIGTGTLHVTGREFRAKGIHGKYEGTIAVRSDMSPAQVDFTIRSCRCRFEGMTSTGIFYEGDGALVFASPPPGDPRPESFDGLDLAKVMVERATRPGTGDEQPDARK